MWNKRNYDPATGKYIIARTEYFTDEVRCPGCRRGCVQHHNGGVCKPCYTRGKRRQLRHYQAYWPKDDLIELKELARRESVKIEQELLRLENESYHNPLGDFSHPPADVCEDCLRTFDGNIGISSCGLKRVCPACKKNPGQFWRVPNYCHLGVSMCSECGTRKHFRAGLCRKCYRDPSEVLEAMEKHRSKFNRRIRRIAEGSNVSRKVRQELEQELGLGEEGAPVSLEEFIDLIGTPKPGDQLDHIVPLSFFAFLYGPEMAPSYANKWHNLRWEPRGDNASKNSRYRGQRWTSERGSTIYVRKGRTRRLTHKVTDEHWDRAVLGAMLRSDAHTLIDQTPQSLGSSLTLCQPLASGPANCYGEYNRI